jgi:acetate kinase
MSSDRPRTGNYEPYRSLLTINGGSSSLKFAVFSSGSELRRKLSGRIERIGTPQAALAASDAKGRPASSLEIGAGDHAQAAERLADWLDKQADILPIAAVGHRIVHGGLKLTEHQRATEVVLDELRANRSLDLAHLPQEIAMIEVFGRAWPGVPQMVCFDTAFHRNLPRVSQLLPIPRTYIDAGFRRLGFHGLSYEYLLVKLRRVAGEAADGRVILAHLGSGASLAAVHRGRPVDTTMAFTPTAGVVMGTRPGDLDPGLLLHLERLEGRLPEDMDRYVSEKFGLFGVSGGTSDMRDLLARVGTDVRAAEAVELFVYQIAKTVGAYATVLEGLDTLVFSGGVGERSAAIRSRICARLAAWDVRIDESRNAAGAAVISTGASSVTVRVIPTDEEIVIARAVRGMLEEP